MRRIYFAIVVGFVTGSCLYDDIKDPSRCKSSDLMLTLDTVQSASNCTATDGSIAVSASGGELPYTFLLNHRQEQSSGDFSALGPGTYTISVKDNRGCEVSLNNVSIPAEGFVFTVSLVDDTQCLGGNGSITVDVSEGKGPYAYALNANTFGDNNTFTNLSAGSYAVAVKDNEGCVVQMSLVVPQGITGTTWANDILPIMQAKCATRNCHDGRYRPDFSKYDKAIPFADQIKSKTQDRTMPFDGSLTQDQIDLIACWVNDGAPLN